MLLTLHLKAKTYIVTMQMKAIEHCVFFSAVYCTVQAFQSVKGMKFKSVTNHMKATEHAVYYDAQISLDCLVRG